MSTAHAIPELDAPGLKRFGLTTGGIVAVLFGILFPWILARAIPLWPWILAAILIGWGLTAPASLRPVYRGWMALGLLLNKVTTPIVMGAVFFVAITPMGALRRLLGHKLPMDRDTALKSYRRESKKARPEDLERPF